MQISSYLKVTGSMSYGSDDETPKRKENKPEKKNLTEIETLTKFIERPKNYFTDPILDFAEKGKSSFLQIENLYINDVKQW